ncbi:hypothetical protein GCM10010193_15580 [Kitasatospora atroaurantiaca]
MPPVEPPDVPTVLRPCRAGPAARGGCGGVATGVGASTPFAQEKGGVVTRHPAQADAIKPWQYRSTHRRKE